MLESFTLKQHLDATRQELSQALYQHDAACRIIARLMRERDETRAMLQSWQQMGGNVNVGRQDNAKVINDDAGVVKGLGEDLITTLNAKNQELAAGRKGRKPSAGVVSKEYLSNITVQNTITPHKTDKQGVTCIAVHEGGDFLLTGGADKTVVVTSKSSGLAVAKLSGHSKKITKVAFASNSNGNNDHSAASTTIQFASASSDMSVKVWSNASSDTFSELMTLIGHTNEVTDISMHPTGQHLLSVSLDGSWRFYDVSKEREIVCVKADSEVYSGQLHPDGLIFATGSGSGALKLWDIREQKDVSSVQEHVGALKCLSFSENGYMLASGGSDGMMNLWDLRKMKCMKSTQATEANAGISALSIDFSGLYLAAAAGNTVDILAVKEWAPIKSIKEHSKVVTGLSWGPLASFLTTCSMDRSVKIHSS